LTSDVDSPTCKGDICTRLLRQLPLYSRIRKMHGYSMFRLLSSIWHCNNFKYPTEKKEVEVETWNILTKASHIIGNKRIGNNKSNYVFRKLWSITSFVLNLIDNQSIWMESGKKLIVKLMHVDEVCRCRLLFRHCKKKYNNNDRKIVVLFFALSKE